jgi:hypothetical protein
MSDLRYALRSLRRQPVFYAAPLLTMSAAGFAASAGVFASQYFANAASTGGAPAPVARPGAQARGPLL